MKNLPYPKSSRGLALSERSKSNGFTLIELLVAITIVAVLGAIGIVVFSGVQARSRDAKRSGDLTAIANALEGKKQAGSIFYTHLEDADFAGKSVPVDPHATASTNPQNYCILYDVTVPPVPAPAKPAVGDVNWLDCTVAGSRAKVAKNIPDDTLKVTSFTICAKQEAVTGGVECVSSKL